MNDVTRILSAIEQGDERAAGRLLPLVYDELRKLAARRLAREKPGQTLQATALVHEAYLRLVGGDDSKPWNGRAHFFGAAAEAMRRILVENARRKARIRHGGRLGRVDLDEIDLARDESSNDLLALDAALDGLAEEEPIVAQVVKLRHFAGLTIEQTAAALNISVRTANRHWSFARAWLFQQLNPPDDAAG
jgi:RNA polymerase sigma factor (TIGR02999 family)